MIKKSSRIKYEYNGEQFNIKEIYAQNRKRRGRSKYLLSVDVMLGLEQRQNEDMRTYGELFFYLVDEMADITFSHSLCIIMEALMASLQEILKLSDDQIKTFVSNFESRLPKYIQNALHREAIAA